MKPTEPKAETSRERPSVSRRELFGAGAGTAAVGVYISSRIEQASTGAAHRSGYLETEHVRRYYELARW